MPSVWDGVSQLQRRKTALLWTPTPYPTVWQHPFHSKAETDGTAAVPWQGWQKSGERWEDSHSPAEGQSPAENPTDQEGRVRSKIINVFFISWQPELESCSTALGVQGSSSILETHGDKSTLCVRARNRSE